MIPYYVSNNSDKKAYVFVEQRNVCQRESFSGDGIHFGTPVQAGQQNFNFYSSSQNILCSETSGTWRCTVTIYSSDDEKASVLKTLYARFNVVGDLPGDPGVVIQIDSSMRILNMSGAVENVTHTFD